MGNWFGGGGGSKSKSKDAPPAPVQQFNPMDMVNAQIAANKAAMEQLPVTATALGQVNREQGALDLNQFVQLLSRPGSVIYPEDIKKLEDQIKKIDDTANKLRWGINNPTATRDGKGINYQDPIAGENKYATFQEAESIIASLKQEKQKTKSELSNFRNYDPQKTFDQAFPGVSSAQTQLLGGLRSNLTTSPEYKALQKELSKDFKGKQMKPQDIKASTTKAAKMKAATAKGAQVSDVKDVRAATGKAAAMQSVDDVRSRNVRADDAGRALMSEARGEGLLGQLEQQASGDLALGRSLSAEQERDAVQSARSGMAARGLATGNSALAAELLNRDRFATQREAERRNFAGQVLNQGANIRQAASDIDFRRQDTNAGRALQADLANQQTDFATGQFNAGNRQQMSLANMANQQQANLANFDFDTNRAMTNAQMAQQNQQFNASNLQAARALNAGFLQDANQFNATQRQATNIYNQQNLQDALAYNNQLGMTLQQANLGNRFQQASLAQDERLRRLGVQEAIVGQTMGNSPMNLLLGAPQPNNQIGGLAAQTSLGGMQMGAAGYTFGINQNNSLYNNWANNRAAIQAANITGGATNNAGWMAMLGGVAQGAGALGGGYLASDRRLKTDIKKIGTDPLGLNTYSYRYKGDDRTRTGPMAQEVRKVLPEAVEEVEIKGKKRLAIRPKVLGQAYAQALEDNQQDLLKQGYTVK
jgi:hypothetical protein